MSKVAVIVRRKKVFDNWLRTMNYADREQFHYLETLREAHETDFAGVIRVGDDWWERWNAVAMYDVVRRRL